MRTFKTGLDYFSFDIDFFEDEKVEFVSAKFGELGELILIKLLCRIYRSGYFIEFGEDEQLLFAKRSGENITPELVKLVVDEAIKRNFFSKEHFEKFQILTSNGIQKRYFEATQRRKEIPLFREYLINDNINLENVNIIGLNGDIKKQSRVKQSKAERKGKESRGKQRKSDSENEQPESDFFETPSNGKNPVDLPFKNAWSALTEIFAMHDVSEKPQAAKNRERKITSLVDRFDDSFILEKVEHFNWCLTHRRKLLRDNPIGYLIKSIEDQYPPPAGYEEYREQELKRKRVKETIEKSLDDSGEEKENDGFF